MDEAGIARSLQEALDFYRVKAQVRRRENRLHVLITRERDNDIDYSVLFEVVRNSLEHLAIPGVEGFVLYGRLAGEKQPEWQQGSEFAPMPSLDDLLEASEQMDRLVEEVQVESGEPAKTTDVQERRNEFVSLETLESLQIPNYYQDPTVPAIPPLPSLNGAKGDDREVVSPLPEVSQRAGMGWLVPTLAIATFLVLLGGGWYVWDGSRQRQKVAEAKALAARAIDPSQLGKLEALRQTKADLDRATLLVQDVPNLPGYPYSAAQDVLVVLQPKLEKTNRRLAKEEAAARKFALARQMALEAAVMVQNPPHPLPVWESALKKWQEAVKQLEGIPPEGTLVSESARKTLERYRVNLTIATVRLERERMVAAAATYWASQVAPGVRDELKLLKAQGVSRAVFVPTCAETVRPTFAPATLKRLGFGEAPFAVRVCERAWDDLK